MKLDYHYLNATLWRTANGAIQVRQDDLLQAVVSWKTDEVSDPLPFAKLVEIRTGKGRIPPEPKTLKSRPIALNQWRDKVDHAFG